MKPTAANGRRQLAGQVILTGIPGPVLERTTRDALDRVRPSGIILFRRNVEDVAQLRRLTAELHALPWRPLVAIDHEGGAVMRLGPPLTQFPPVRWITRAGTPELAHAVGRAMGVELASVGIDINLAPVLDVNSNPANPVIGERAFADNPADVAAFGVAMMRGLAAGSVLPCGKHFPGHGDTDRDSHTDLPVVGRSHAALEAVELVPFRAAISAAVPMLMTAHVRYPALDDHHPATLSPIILRRLLRGELAFRGVVVSDDLGMRAVSAGLSVADAAVAALRAGVDWLLICKDLGDSEQAAEAVAAAAASGDLDPTELAAAAARIRHLARPVRRRARVALPALAHQELDHRIRTAVGETL